MTYPGNARTDPLGTFLAWCRNAPLAEVLVALNQLRNETGLAVPVVMTVDPGSTTGPDAPGATITGNPILVGGNNQTGVIKPFLTDGAGVLLTVAEGRDDAAGNRVVLTDRSGILSVAPPVSKLWSASGSFAGVAPTISQAAPGAGLRNVVLAWGFTLSTGATAQPTQSIGFGVGSGPVAPYPIQTVACPANDFRSFAATGPIVFPPATQTVFSGNTAGVLAAILGVWMVGYVAAFP